MVRGSELGLRVVLSSCRVGESCAESWRPRGVALSSSCAGVWVRSRGSSHGGMLAPPEVLAGHHHVEGWAQTPWRFGLVRGRDGLRTLPCGLARVRVSSQVYVNIEKPSFERLWNLLVFEVEAGQGGGLGGSGVQ